ncbi:DEAD/DEAH box helicase [Candidatus Enterococcus willemsii]|uniref:DNA/RNA helicase n=1 Tax=Candidatus Enterococcus willemsii TaxID=1857215 RepID=A0ABQ6Z1T8_9ENTE|nr:DEAD/DEAH box helicase [Enterococcus sp. CU12B]KAF1305488.1 DNA/RNA helicase [Enterococcus sp. CU12B]
MEEYLGRQLAVLKDQEISEQLSAREAIIVAENCFCQRCGTAFTKEEVWLPNGAYYCPACIRFGRLTSNHQLVSQHATKTHERKIHFNWDGSLTPPQQHVAKAIVTNYQEGWHSMIWSVTGSGKTEMIFPIIKKVLANGGRVCITSPRIDVCRELYPRIVSTFPDEKTLLLYGGSEEAYRYNALTICTTHQLMNFYQAFDLLIVDEIDAFPYEGDPQLRFALKQSIKKEGRFVYLTATPPNHLLQEVAESFRIEKLPIRFHQRPLIVPEIIWYEEWERCYQRHRSRKLIRLLRQLLKDNAVLVFCPSIAYMERVYQAVRSFFPVEQTACVSSQDSEREQKVQQMRQKKYQILFCTTILERGVTFENVSVIIMGANHAVYTKSALVQIAGRVDRKGEFNYGRVLFVLNQQTYAIRQACREIKEMNRLAKRWQTDEV